MGRVTVNSASRSPFLSPPYLLVLAALLPALVLVWGPGYPQGADTWGHLFKAEYLAERMRGDAGPAAYWQSAWMPAWYMGDPYRTYYPPLTTLTLAPLIYLLRDPFIAYRAFASLFLILFSHVTFGIFAGRWPRERWQAAFTAVLALWAPYTLRTLFFEGNLPRILAVLAVPVIAALTESLLGRPGPLARRLAGLSLAWTWAIVAHPQQAYMFAVGFGLYAVMRVIVDAGVPLLRLVWVALPIALGALVAAPWALPAYSGGELANIPYLPPVKVELFSAPLRAIAPAVGVPPGAVVFGTGTLLLALLSVIARPSPRHTAWMISGLACLWFALGPAGVAFSLLPGSGQLLPERFANFSAFALPMAAGGLVPLGIRARNARLAVILGLVFIDAFPSLPLLRNRDYPEDRAAIARLLAQQPGSGRVALLTYPEPTALDVYFASAVGAHDQISGWALENTPHHPALRRVLSAPEWGPEYLQRLFGLWNVRYAILSGEEQAVRLASHVLSEAGFKRQASSGLYELWRLDQVPSPIQALPSHSMLVIGEQTEPYLAAYPFAEDGSRSLLVDYTREELEAHSVLGLMRFHRDRRTLAEAEARLRDWVSPGRVAIVEMTGMEEPFSQGIDFLGVGVVRLAFQDPMHLFWQGPLAGQPDWLSLDGLPEPGWNGAVYRGLDVVLAEVEHNGIRYPVLGYKEVGAGRVWFIGLNLLYYGQVGNAAFLADAIAEATLAQARVDRHLTLAPVSTEAVELGDGRLAATYASGEPVQAVVSFTYSPRWRAAVDGEPVALGEYQHLMRVSLPAGRHRLEIRYAPYGTLWPRLGVLAGLVGAMLVGGIAVGERARLRRQARAQAEASAPAEERADARRANTGFSPCLNCGFRFSEVLPPTPATYPFNLISCPICTQRLDGTGFRSGRAMTAEDRQEALARWLSFRGFTLTSVDPQRDFGVDAFFEGDQVLKPEAESA